MPVVRFTIKWMVVLFCLITWARSKEIYQGADHRFGDYTWEHSLQQWDIIEKAKEQPHAEWTWVPLNYRNEPGDLSHGGMHEAWGWYEIER